MRASTLALAVAISVVQSSAFGQSASPQATNYFLNPPNASNAMLPKLPAKLPSPTDNNQLTIDIPGLGPKETTIIPELQSTLTSFIADRGSPIAGVIIADAKNGDILAMAEGRSPESWGGTTHSALHAQFPAASLFKTVITSAAFEVANVNAEQPLGLSGGCGNVEPTGRWMYDNVSGPHYMTMKRAFGLSCNSFFAKLAVNELGLGVIKSFAQKFGYGSHPNADFYVDAGSILPPSATTSSTYTVGRFAAGFGMVTTSVAHIATTMLAVANNGAKVPLRLFRDTPIPDKQALDHMIQPETAGRLRNIMKATIRGGTASFAFSRGKTRNLRGIVGGKTGTLMGKSPFGLTTLFSGMMPIDNPKIVVAAIVVLEDRWIIKAPSLAAEAFQAWSEYRGRNPDLTTARKAQKKQNFRQNNMRRPGRT